MIPVFMQCSKCKRYERSPDEGGEQVRTMTSQGKVIYSMVPHSWHMIVSYHGKAINEMVFCGDCLPNVLKEVFP